MTEQEAYQEHIRYTHDTYCRIVIHDAQGVGVGHFLAFGATVDHGLCGGRHLVLIAGELGGNIVMCNNRTTSFCTRWYFR